MRYDIVIRGGTIYDGSGSPGFNGDVGIADDRIRAIGDLTEAHAGRIIDATGLAVCPGFIDPHTHCHVNVEDGLFHADNLLRQGITTVIAGNCGRSGWPVSEHFKQVEDNGFRTNYAMLVGHHTVRWRLIPSDDRRPPTHRELKEMQRMIEHGLSEGACGVTIGYAQRHEHWEELLAVLGPAAEAGTIFASHIRSESAELIQAVAELIELAEKVGIRAQVSHLKTLNPSNWGKLDIVLAMIEDAVARGIDVAADRYPYCAGHGGSTNMMPLWCYVEAKARGGKEHLKDPDLVDRFREAVDLHLAEFGGPDKIVFTSLKTPDPEIDGKTPADLQREWNCEMIDVALEVERRSDAAGGIGAMIFGMSEDNLRRILRHPLVMVGSDAALVGDRARPTHPRMYGTFPRVLGTFVREERLLSLPEAVRKMTSFAAERFGLRDRGRLRPGAYADVVCFDPDTITDRATYMDAHQYPVGIAWVLVNGRVAVANGASTPDCHGRVIRAGQ